METIDGLRLGVSLSKGRILPKWRYCVLIFCHVMVLIALLIIFPICVVAVFNNFGTFEKATFVVSLLFCGFVFAIIFLFYTRRNMMK